MLKISKLLISFSLFFVATFANAGPCPDYYGSGSNCYGAVAVSPSGRENAQVGAVIGSGLGYAISRSHPAAGVMIGGGAGYLLGRRVDRREEMAERAAVAQAQAIGWTECNYDARKSGIDQNGSYNQSARSGKVVPGYKQSCN